MKVVDARRAHENRSKQQRVGTVLHRAGGEFVRVDRTFTHPTKALERVG